jgi:hypothetical protein
MRKINIKIYIILLGLIKKCWHFNIQYKTEDRLGSAGFRMSNLTRIFYPVNNLAVSRNMWLILLIKI